MSRVLLLGFIFLNAACATAAVKIHSVSNVENGVAIAEVWGSQRLLRQVDMKTGGAVEIPWPDALKDEEIIGSFLTGDRFYVIAQWTAGGGKPPTIYGYDRKTKAWKNEKTSVDCISFDTVELRGSRLSLQCEADPLKNTKARKVEVKLPVGSNSAKVQKFVFPLTASSEGDYSYKLEGDLFEWRAIQLLHKGTPVKTIQADGL